MVRLAPRHRSIAALGALLTAMACAAPGIPPGPVQPTPIVFQNSQSTLAVNAPPRIVALALGTDRIEVGEEVTITATVVDDETPVEDLAYRWEATSGTITGTGRVVRWKPSIGSPTPAAYKVSLHVVERYGTGELSSEHSVKAEAPAIYVNDSPKEVQGMSELFLRDFANSRTDADTCLRNFSDSCPGKAQERRDIINNRNTRTILSSTVSNQRVRFNSARTTANFTAKCTFTERLTATGVVQVADGTCDLDLVYRDHRWWLCESSYHGLNEAGLSFIF